MRTTTPDSIHSGRVFGLIREAMDLSIDDVGAATWIEPALLAVIEAGNHNPGHPDDGPRGRLRNLPNQPRTYPPKGVVLLMRRCHSKETTECFSYTLHRPRPLSAQRPGAVWTSGRTQDTARADVDRVPERVPPSAQPVCSSATPGTHAVPRTPRCNPRYPCQRAA